VTRVVVDPWRRESLAWMRNATTGSQSRLGWMRLPGDIGKGGSLAARTSGVDEDHRHMISITLGVDEAPW
jgi:hypothetical protein